MLIQTKMVCRTNGKLLTGKIDESDYVIDTGCPVGQMNAMLKDVLEYAAEKKKIILKKPDIDTLKSLFTGE